LRGARQKSAAPFSEIVRREYRDKLMFLLRRKATSTGRPLCGEKTFDDLEALLNRNLKPKKGGRPRKKKS